MDAYLFKSTTCPIRIASFIVFNLIKHVVVVKIILLWFVEIYKLLYYNTNTCHIMKPAYAKSLYIVIIGFNELAGQINLF